MDILRDLPQSLQTNEEITPRLGYDSLKSFANSSFINCTIRRSLVWAFLVKGKAIPVTGRGIP
jgi:hypothetical protein